MYILLLNLIDNDYIIVEKEEYQDEVKNTEAEEFLIPVAESSNMLHLTLISEVNTLSN